MHFLNSIILAKQKEVARRKERTPLEQLRKASERFLNNRSDTARPFKKSLIAGQPFSVIAEIKRASPSEGALTNATCRGIADMYAASNVDAVSVITDSIHFKGALACLGLARGICSQPIFRKDFIIDEYQVYETLLAGGDAFLLIASVLNIYQLRACVALGKKLGLETMAEVRDREDIEKALIAGAEIIGINNRNLDTFKIDLSVTERLMPYIPNNMVVISESGIVSNSDVRRVIAAGARGILVGSSIVKADDPVEKINAFKQAV